MIQHRLKTCATKALITSEALLLVSLISVMAMVI